VEGEEEPEEGPLREEKRGRSFLKEEGRETSEGVEIDLEYFPERSLFGVVGEVFFGDFFPKSPSAPCPCFSFSSPPCPPCLSAARVSVFVSFRGFVRVTVFLLCLGLRSWVEEEGEGGEAGREEGLAGDSEEDSGAGDSGAPAEGAAAGASAASVDSAAASATTRTAACATAAAAASSISLYRA
jgi:hypothetical protein